MAIKIVRCSKRDKRPPIAYRGPIIPEALETPVKICPLLSAVLKLKVDDSGDSSVYAVKNNHFARG